MRLLHAAEYRRGVTGLLCKHLLNLGIADGILEMTEGSNTLRNSVEGLLPVAGVYMSV